MEYVLGSYELSSPQRAMDDIDLAFTISTSRPVPKKMHFSQYIVMCNLIMLVNYEEKSESELCYCNIPDYDYTPLEVRSMYGTFTENSISYELLRALVKGKHGCGLELLQILFKGQTSLTTAVREMAYLCGMYDNLSVCGWLRSTFAGALPYIYNSAIEYGSMNVLREFKYMKPGLLRIARERNPSAVPMIESM